MGCQACHDILDVDDVPPLCETERGCPIPGIEPESARVLDIHARITELSGLVDASAVLKLYGVGIGELELLAVIQRELKAIAKEENGGDKRKG